jgi:outer membrane protein OmpA-like peptidoglycan-associated protein
MIGLHKKSQIAAIGIFLTAASGFVYAQSELGEAAKNATKEAAGEIKSDLGILVEKDMTVVGFAAGQSVLSDAEKRTLQSLADSVRNEKNLQEIVVAAWSDKEYPASADQKLTVADNNLANARADTVKSALVSGGVPPAKINTHSMATHPGWMAKTFRTKDAKLKGAVSAKEKDVEDTVVATIGKELRAKGGPGKAIMVVVRSETSSSH